MIRYKVEVLQDEPTDVDYSFSTSDIHEALLIISDARSQLGSWSSELTIKNLVDPLCKKCGSPMQIKHGRREFDSPGQATILMECQNDHCKNLKTQVIDL